MNFKKHLVNALVPALGLAAMLASSSANALILPLNANIRINFAGWNEATTGYSTNCGSLVGGVDNPNFAACTAAATISARNAYGDSSWGITRITTITANGTTIYSDPVGNGEHITAFFYGLKDGVVQINGNTVNTYSYFGDAAFYSNIGPDPIVGVPGPNGRTGPSSYPAIDSGTLVLQLKFMEGGNASNPNSSLSGSFDAGNFGGGSASLFDIVGGTWEPYFRKNYIFDFDGDYHAMEAEIGFRCGGAATNVECNPLNINPNLMSLATDGSLFGQTIPEPTSLSLMLIGVVYLIRRHIFG